MTRERLIDLDELVLRCRDEEARKYINEAVSCYRAGAFRACVVTTWIAIVYDFIHKLRQLARTGDNNAQNKLEEFERARLDPAKALKFERSILRWAVSEFQFISELQSDDLERLYTDRNRCAHPSMISEEEIYEPTAEVARYHLRNAVTHFLEHPPAQGKAALEQLCNNVLSAYFPRTTEQAIEYLGNTAFQNAKQSLIRNFIVRLLKEFLLFEEYTDDASQQRIAAAINASRFMYRAEFEALWASELNSIFQQVPPNKMYNIARFLYLVVDTWDYLSADRRITIETYIEEMEKEETVNYAFLFEVPQLCDRLTQKLTNLDVDSLAILIEAVPRKDYLPTCVTLYENCESIYQANQIALRLLVPLSPYFDVSSATRISQAIDNNPHVALSSKVRLVLEGIGSNNNIPTPLVDEIYEKYSIASLYNEADSDEIQ